MLHWLLHDVHWGSILVGWVLGIITVCGLTFGMAMEWAANSARIARRPMPIKRGPED